MKELFGLVAAIAAAVTAVASCSDKLKPSPQSPVPQQQKEQVGAVPPSTFPPPPSTLPPPPSSQVLSPSTNVIPSIFASYRELIQLNQSPIRGNNGVSAQMRLEDARERVRLANYIAQNAHFLGELVSSNPEIRLALEEAKKLPIYQAELSRLSASAQ